MSLLALWWTQCSDGLRRIVLVQEVVDVIVENRVEVKVQGRKMWLADKNVLVGEVKMFEWLNVKLLGVDPALLCLSCAQANKTFTFLLPLVVSLDFYPGKQQELNVLVTIGGC